MKKIGKVEGQGHALQCCPIYSFGRHLSIAAVNFSTVHFQQNVNLHKSSTLAAWIDLTIKNRITAAQFSKKKKKYIYIWSKNKLYTCTEETPETHFWKDFSCSMHFLYSRHSPCLDGKGQKKTNSHTHTHAHTHAHAHHLRHTESQMWIP